MQRQERQVDSALDALIERVNDIKLTIIGLLNKLDSEYNSINWPTFLDNFALLSSELTAIRKLLNKNRMPCLQELTVLPLKLSPQCDESLMQMTEDRVPAFAHDVVPNYLRTRPDPELEQRHKEMENNVSDMSQEEIQKEVAEFSEVVDHVLKIVHEARETWGIEETAHKAMQTSTSADTQMLASAVGVGRGLRVPLTGARMSSLPVRCGTNNSQNSGTEPSHELDNLASHEKTNGNVKSPTLKTNIKARESDNKGAFQR
ncbi:Mediator of RNA polymerase II transcription subunit 8 [Gryllus bimaculatus]|nr:Mediator of RNA polymerase II transcription subunit 8 [Gryllus bimaculatus]